jgi:glycosyltransferase involved in cell wall biosynthesis
VNNNSSDNTERIAKEYGARVIFEKEHHIAKVKTEELLMQRGST